MRPRRLGLLACTAGLLLLICGPRPAAAQAPAVSLAETAQPDIAKLLPPGIAAAKSFTVAVSLGSPPDDFRDQNGQIVGWEIDILSAAAQVLGVQAEFRPITFDTLIPGLQAKRFDAAVGELGVTTVREKVVDMIGTLFGNELFAARSDSPIVVKSLDDLCGLAVGTTRGSREMHFVEEQNPKCTAAGKQPINALAFNDGNGAAEALMSRRADLYWLGSTAISYFVAQSHGRAKIVGSYTDTSYIGIALPKESDFSKALQAAVQHLIDDGTYSKIVQKWGLEGGAIKQAPLNPTGTPS